MDVHIDWVSWTLPTEAQPKDISDLYNVAKGLCNGQAAVVGKTVFNGDGYEAGPGRPPYRIAILREDHGCAIYGGSHTDTALFELSGRGCDRIRKAGMAVNLIEALGESVTRIDIACDVLTDTQPAVFSNQRTHQRFRSIGFVRSDSGETCYIGSPKSDRFCRVYRYNSPHPRSALLRIEFVFRRGHAKNAAADISEAQGLETFAARSGNTFGFNHRDWQPHVKTDERVTVPTFKRSDEDTVRWLYAQVAPAMRRVLESGALQIDEFLEVVFND